MSAAGRRSVSPPRTTVASVVIEAASASIAATAFASWT